MNRYPKTLRIVHLTADQRWRALREGLQGRWQHEPEFCVRELQAYIDTNGTERALQRVLNLLTGTAFRCGTVMHRCINQLRKEVVRRLDARGAESAALRPTHLCPTCDGEGWDFIGRCPHCAGKGILWGKPH